MPLPRKIIALFLVTCVLGLALPALASEHAPPLPAPKGAVRSFENPLGDTTPAAILVRIIEFLLGLVAVLTVAALVYGGIMYILSLGNDGRVQKAKQIIFWAIIGFLIAALALVIINVLGDVLGITGDQQGGSTSSLLVESVYAQDEDPRSLKAGIKNANEAFGNDLPSGGRSTLGKLIFNVINFLLGLVAVLALGAIVWGAIVYITSAGDEQKAGQAKKTILYAIIGLLVAGLSFLIIQQINNLIR